MSLKFILQFEFRISLDSDPHETYIKNVNVYILYRNVFSGPGGPKGSVLNPVRGYHVPLIKYDTLSAAIYPPC